MLKYSNFVNFESRSYKKCLEKNQKKVVKLLKICIFAVLILKLTIKINKMKKTLTVLFLFCAFTGFAQQILLKSKWDQGYPYNMLCPRDPFNGYAYCAAGCPAVAMGQIINYLRMTQGTRFDDGDDYHHDYAGRVYDIDDDWETLQFPSFPKLNVLLDSVDAYFQRGDELSDTLKAAVIFACGTACTQIYTSDMGSGTFYVDQAFAAYKRFGFTECQLFRDPTDEMYELLISNLEDGYPAHLAVENPEGTVGHNVVVDGYRESDGKFHINFGWGGPNDNWYDIPDPNFAYEMTKVEGIILNIIPKEDGVQELASQQLAVYPNPASDVIYIDGMPGAMVDYAIFNVMGQKVTEGYSDGTISVAELEKGLYILQIKGEKFHETAKFIVK